ncbi:MAG: LamG domain-containing protein, partial [Planctomycetota bacterium]
LPLQGDASDASPAQRPVKAQGAVAWDAPGPQRGKAARFDGRDTALEIASGDVPDLGRGAFSLSVWVDTDAAMKDVPGDIISQYDPAKRRGFHLTLKTNAGVTTTQANFRQLQFGIDDDRLQPWGDCGQPGGVLAFALTAYNGELFAGTCEPGRDQAGHVYRYAGGTRWTDCGSPAPCNAVTALAEFEGKLYAGTGKYRLAGSALAESDNTHRGGQVFRYDADGRWIDCGQLDGVEAIGGMVVYDGRLYAASLYRPAGFFRYDGGSKWTALPTPGARVEALGVYNGYLYATSYDGGHVYRFDGSAWTDCGQLGAAEENTQTYSFAVHRGRLFVGTWRSGRVYHFEDLDRWTDVGRLGEELEVMGMLVHNGRLLAGTLPLAEVYAYQGESQWQRLTQLDHTPEVRYRRAWTMAEHDGRVFCSTLPSGRIYSTQAGTSAMAAGAFPAGWHHVAAVRSDALRLYVDGHLVAESAQLEPGPYNLTSEAPLRIGAGANDHFLGRLSDVRLYGRALSAAEIAALAATR